MIWEIDWRSAGEASKLRNSNIALSAIYGLLERELVKRPRSAGRANGSFDSGGPPLRVERSFTALSEKRCAIHHGI